MGVEDWDDVCKEDACTRMGSEGVIVGIKRYEEQGGG